MTACTKDFFSGKFFFPFIIPLQTIEIRMAIKKNTKIKVNLNIENS
jgi:hypothetical protein